VATLPLNLTRSLRALREASANASEPASIVLAGDPALIQLVREKFAVDGAVPSIVSLDTFSGPRPGELLVVLASAAGEPQARTQVDRIPFPGSIILAVDEGPGTRNKAGHLPNGVVRLAFSNSPAGWDALFSLCAEAVGDKGVALGRRYPVVRRAAAHRLISRTATQNVFIAMVFFMPGSDMPAMTLNQARMVLNIAALYGQHIDQDRATELAAMIGLGFAFRGVARLLVRAIPGASVIMRIATAYSATMAIGLAAIQYYEKGAPASTSKVIGLVGSLRR
jgi:uncharacterized protein (DUF697 family)